jgi:peptidoglycan/xylan/chitin deacetylase (PgdA/CDA1 family)
MTLTILPNNLSVILKNTIGSFTTSLLFDRLLSDTLVIFNYHDICDDPSPFSTNYHLAVEPQLFIKQLKWIKKYFNVISPIELLKGNYDRPAAMITFDDGFKSAFNFGSETITNEGLSATIFVNMAPVNGEIFWSGLVTYLCNNVPIFQKKMLNKYNVNLENLFLYIKDEDILEFKELDIINNLAETVKNFHGEFADNSDLENSNNKNIFIGNHLYNHYNALNISKEKLKELYLKNSEELKKFKNSVNLFSYPFGQPDTCYSEATDKLLYTLGATHIFTAYPLVNKRKDTTHLHRVSLFNSINTEEKFRYHCAIPTLVNNLIRKQKYSFV